MELHLKVLHSTRVRYELKRRVEAKALNAPHRNVENPLEIKPN